MELPKKIIMKLDDDQILEISGHQFEKDKDSENCYSFNCHVHELFKQPMASEDGLVEVFIDLDEGIANFSFSACCQHEDDTLFISSYPL